MEPKRNVWHVIPKCEPTRITTAASLWQLFPDVFSTELQSRLIYISNKLNIPLDDRMHHAPGRKPSAYSQERQFEWARWVRAMLISPVGKNTGRMAIFIYRTRTKQLELCSQLRRVNEGTFARRLTDEPQQIFMATEELVMLKSAGIYGGIDLPTRQLPEKIALY